MLTNTEIPPTAVSFTRRISVLSFFPSRCTLGCRFTHDGVVTGDYDGTVGTGGRRRPAILQHNLLVIALLIPQRTADAEQSVLGSGVFGPTPSSRGGDATTVAEPLAGPREAAGDVIEDWLERGNAGGRDDGTALDAALTVSLARPAVSPSPWRRAAYHVHFATSTVSSAVAP